jgi:hypothetical protein
MNESGQASSAAHFVTRRQYLRARRPGMALDQSKNEPKAKVIQKTPKTGAAPEPPDSSGDEDCLKQGPNAAPKKHCPPRKHRFIYEHSLSITSIAIVTALILLYSFSNPNTHLGSFFGNAIADWSGVVVTVLMTKFLYERGSAESRRLKGTVASPVLEFLREHSLSIFLLITGAGWVFLFIKMDPNAKWGQVVGNLVSEWTQIFGLVLLTKHMIEKHSKESSR